MKILTIKGTAQPYTLKINNPCYMVMNKKKVNFRIKNELGWSLNRGFYS
jgi:hypothetical protein